MWVRFRGKHTHRSRLDLLDDWLKKALAWVWPEHRPITKSEILAELPAKTAVPGVLPTWLQPIQTRLVMRQSTPEPPGGLA